MDQNRLTLILVVFVLWSLFLTENAGCQVMKVNVKVNSMVGVQEMKSYEVIPRDRLNEPGQGALSGSYAVDAIHTVKITGKKNTEVVVSFHAPDVLVNKENKTMPFQLALAWDDKGACKVNDLKWITTGNNVFKIGNGMITSDRKTQQDEDLQAYLYIKSTAEIPVNSSVPFEGKVNLTIEY